MPIRWRLTIFHAATTLAIAALLTVALMVLLGRAVHTSVEATARARAMEVAWILDSGREFDPADVSRLSGNGVFVIARDEQGRAVLQTAGLVAEVDGPDGDLWRRALASGEAVEGHVYLPSATRRGPVYIYALPVGGEGSPIRVVEVAKSYASTGRDLFFFAPIVALAAIGGVLVAIGGSYFLARAALAPVSAITESAREMTAGDLSKRLPVKSRRDELGRLAETFNDFLARLEVAFTQREEALQQQRRFVADAGHELRTPLTSIVGYARMLRRWGLDDPAVAREAVAAVEQEANRMSKLVEGLLNLARGDEVMSLDLGHHSLADVAADAVEAARAAAGDRITINYQLPGHPVNAVFDRDRIHQLASILLDNAAKYSPDGATVTVTVRANDAAAELEVVDTGIGIPAEHLPHIFDRFYRVDEARSDGGSGLGLAIASQIAKMHGGRIDVMSRPGEGSTFTVRLPRTSQE